MEDNVKFHATGVYRLLEFVKEIIENKRLPPFMGLNFPVPSP